MLSSELPPVAKPMQAGRGPRALEGGKMRSRSGLVGLFILVVVAAGCTAGKSTGAAPSAPAATHSADEHAQHEDLTTTSPATATPEQRPLLFDQLLGQHAVLAARQMRTMVLPAPDTRQAAADSLRSNTDSLAQLVGSAYGGPQGSAFKSIWQRQNTDMSSYAQSVANKDAAATDKVRSDLMADADGYGAWLAKASKGRLEASAGADLARAHVQDLMRQVDAYAARDYGQSYELERQAYERLFASGVTLAKGAVAPKAAAAYDAPTERLRSAFAMLLGEHMEMIVDAQRAAFATPEEFKAAGAQVNANTAALTQAMAGIVGPRQASEFQSAWADHVDGLMGYTAAVARGDDVAKPRAVEKLNELAVNLAVYFSHVVKDQKTVVPLTGAVTQHDTHLTDQVDAYAAKDYPKAQQMENSAYTQMIGVSNTLVDSIQHSVKAAMPVGGSQTGGGGTAHERR